ncbi:MAG: hypothetical protein IKY33_02415 [Clostridia bacterium]|nr:hypothetical protein [Clostridia bacterium]
MFLFLAAKYGLMCVSQAITNRFTAIIDLLAFIIIFVQESRGRRGIAIGRKQ